MQTRAEVQPTSMPAIVDCFTATAPVALAVTGHACDSSRQHEPVTSPDSEDKPADQSPSPLFRRLAALNKRLNEQSDRLATSSSLAPVEGLGVSFNNLPPVQTRRTSPKISTGSGRPRTTSPSAIRNRPVGSTLRSWLTDQAAAPREWHESNHTFRDWSHNTAFFRDDSIWLEFLSDVALFAAARAAIDRSSAADAALRVWSCGCSSGEELFTIRMCYERWVAPTFAEAIGRAPTFCGLGTDRSAAIVDTAQDVACNWSAQALANVPHEFFRPDAFVELPESNADRVARLAREYASGERELPIKRYALPASARSSCAFAVEDLAAASDSPADAMDIADCVQHDRVCSNEPAELLCDLILCRYSVFLYANDEASARRALSRILSRLAPTGILVLGLTDNLPRCASALLEPVPVPDCMGGSTAMRDWLSVSQNSLKRATVNAWRWKQQARPGTAPSALPSARDGVGSDSIDVSDAPVDMSRGKDRLAAALTDAVSLQQWRHKLGMRPRFAEDPPAATSPFHLSHRSLSILQRKGLDEVAPLAKRAMEIAQKREERLEEMRRQKEAREDEEIRQAAEALKSNLRNSRHRREGIRTPQITQPPKMSLVSSAVVLSPRTSTLPRATPRASTAPTNLHRPTIGGGGRGSRPEPALRNAQNFLERMQEEMESRASRLAALEQSTKEQYESKWGMKRSRRRAARKAAG